MVGGPNSSNPYAVGPNARSRPPRCVVSVDGIASRIVVMSLTHCVNVVQVWKKLSIVIAIVVFILTHHHHPPLREVLRRIHLGIYFPAPPLAGDHRQATTLTIHPSPPLDGPGQGVVYDTYHIVSVYVWLDLTQLILKILIEYSLLDLINLPTDHYNFGSYRQLSISEIEGLLTT